MSDTPETDAAKMRCFCRFDQGGIYDAEAEKAADGEWVPIEVAEDLERERNEARAEAARNAEELRQVREEKARLREASAVTQALAEWSKRYPRGVIYSASNHQMDAELIKLEELAKYAAEKLQTSTP